MKKKFLVDLPKSEILEKSSIAKELIPAHRYLAELKGVLNIIPNEAILLTNLTLQEAKDTFLEGCR